jgi:hypothetical protein
MTILQGKDVKLKYNNINGAWRIKYKGPSEVYQCEEFGIMQPGAAIKQVYRVAGQAVLGMSGLVIPPINEIEIEIVDEI